MGRPTTLMMSGAWPPPAPSVWKVWMVRPLKAAIVSSTKPDSLSVSVWIATWTSYSSATRQAAVDRGRRGAPVLVQLEPAGAGRDLLAQRLGQAGVALAEEADVDRQAPRPPAACGRCARGRACRWWRWCRSAGPVPPPNMVVTPRRQRLVQDCCGQMKWMWESMPPAVTIRPSPAIDLGAGADDDVDAGLGVRVAGLADARRSGRP